MGHALTVQMQLCHVFVKFSRSLEIVPSLLRGFRCVHQAEWTEARFDNF